MAKVRHEKVVSSLPGTLKANTIYYVRVGTGFDIYVTNGAGTIVAYPMNIPTTQTGYTIFPIWAEEGAALNDGAYEWAYGNGDDSQDNFGIVVPVDCELFAVSLNLFDGTADVDVLKNGANTNSIVSATAGGTFLVLDTPVPYKPGDNCNFQTIKGAASNGGKVCAWFRVPLVGLKGDKGDKGDAGTGGGLLRVTCKGQNDVNGSGASILWEAATIDTMGGASIGSDFILLTEGFYEVTLNVTFSSTVQRANVHIEFQLDGVPYSQRSGSNYIRSYGGHNTAGDNISDLIEIRGEQKFSIVCSQEAVAGTVTLVGNKSRLTLKRVT